MRNILLFALILSQQSFACEFPSRSLHEKIYGSDFIATARIISIEPDFLNADYHNIELEVIELFKGYAESKMKIYSILNTSCSFYTPVNTKWLIFASHKSNGYFSFGAGSQSIRLDRIFDSDKFPSAEAQFNNKIERTFNILRILKSNDLLTNDSKLLLNLRRAQCLLDFKGHYTTSSDFALYVYNISQDLKIDKIEVLQNFNNEKLDSEILECLKNDSRIFGRRPSTTKHSKLFLIVYYYQSDKNYKGFISTSEL